MREVIMKDNLM